MAARKKARGTRTSSKRRDATADKSERTKAQIAERAKKSGSKQGFGTGATKHTKRTPAARARFLEKLAESGLVSIAAASIDMSRSSVYEWRNEDKEFARDWDDARESRWDRLEQEAIRRAEEGVVKPIFQQGSKVGTVREYSDGLMALVLKARRRRVYSDNERARGGEQQDNAGVLRVRGELGEADWEEAYGGG